jgi:hypothetical protein
MRLPCAGGVATHSHLVARHILRLSILRIRVLKIILGRTGSQSLPSIIDALPRVFRFIDGLFRYVTLDNLFAVFVTEHWLQGTLVSKLQSTRLLH